MKRTIKNNKQAGFSLVELMIVVAIIGLLAAVGIPQYGKFQAKARTAEARTQLSAIYTAENSFMAEWNQFTVDLKNIGFGVTGTNLRYVTGFTAGTACTSYVTTAGAPTEVTTASNTWSDGTNVNTGAVSASFGPSGASAHPSTTRANGTGAAQIGTTTTCDSTMGSQSFLANSHGDPKNNTKAADDNEWRSDSWTINQRKQLSQARVGY